MPLYRHGESKGVADYVKELILGQDHAIDKIASYIDIYRAGMQTPGRPAGIFLLLGPTGVGKTETVEALAEVLHGTRRHYLRIDCGEFQMEHEVAKLVGAPPGYLGHRETRAILAQERLNAITSDRAPIALILFDEIEKAASSLTRILLGIMDKGTLRLGDGSCSSFENAFIFMTSNLGAKEMIEASAGNPFNFVQEKHEHADLAVRGMRAAQREFPPEFINRVDEVISYKSFSRETAAKIVTLELNKIRKRMWSPASNRMMQIKAEIAKSINGYLTDSVMDSKYGARELKRVIQREIVHPVAKLYLAGVRNMNVILRDGKIIVREAVTSDEA